MIKTLIKVQVSPSSDQHDVTVRYGDLAILEHRDGEQSLAQVINIDREEVSLQIFSGTKGVSTDSSVAFLGHPMQVRSIMVLLLT